MTFFAAAETEVGTVKSKNQDSLCIRIAETSCGQIAMAVVCDGMGGLEKGELASATVIRAFSEWFGKELPTALEGFRWDDVAEKWTHMIKKLNKDIGEYGRALALSLGTTVSAMLLYQDEYLIAHVGDCRVYSLEGELCQLTEDHSVVGREVRRGTLTTEEAEHDPRRNVLTQCVGASRNVTPEILRGKLHPGARYLICSDGFRHEVCAEEIETGLSAARVPDTEALQVNLRQLIQTAMARGEQDNITALVIGEE